MPHPPPPSDLARNIVFFFFFFFCVFFFPVVFFFLFFLVVVLTFFPYFFSPSPTSPCHERADIFFPPPSLRDPSPLFFNFFAVPSCSLFPWLSSFYPFVMAKTGGFFSFMDSYPQSQIHSRLFFFSPPLRCEAFFFFPLIGPTLFFFFSGDSALFKSFAACSPFFSSILP